MNYQRDFNVVVSVAALVAMALSLHGCGGGDSPSPSPTPTPTPVPGWNCPPISVKGQHLYYPNGTQFHVQGIGFPDLSDDANVNDWIDVLKRINQLSPKINAVRIYRPPACALELGSTCFEPFMVEADKLGIYVLIPASGVTWGTFPGTPAGCDPPISTGPTGLQGCYEKGGVLGFGRMMIDNFNYPNTLALVLANEIEQNLQALPVLKAYARDMKIWMQTCNTNSDSPTKGTMRQIPLMYAATDGDTFQEEAGYLFCDDPSVSIDIFGLNVERWCGTPAATQDKLGMEQYDKINAKVKAGDWNGAFLHSEEGGPYGGLYGPRTWAQIPDFANNWPYINGYFAYTYYGKVGFNMFDGTTATATELADGTTFFKEIALTAAYPPSIAETAGTNHQCAASITAKDGSTVTMMSYSDIKIYATGKSGYAENCPKPPSAHPSEKVSISV